MFWQNCQTGLGMRDLSDNTQDGSLSNMTGRLGEDRFDFGKWCRTRHEVQNF
jgi:hypothetical protein